MILKRVRKIKLLYIYYKDEETKSDYVAYLKKHLGIRHVHDWLRVNEERLRIVEKPPKKSSQDVLNFIFERIPEADMQGMLLQKLQKFLPEHGICVLIRFYNHFQDIVFGDGSPIPRAYFIPKFNSAVFVKVRGRRRRIYMYIKGLCSKHGK
jgi:hypothetical protein